MQNTRKKLKLPSPLFKKKLLAVTLVHHENLSYKNIKWLTDSLDKTNVVGLDTEFMVHKICLIQLSTASRCLLIKVKPPTGHITEEYRSKHKKAPLDAFFQSMDIIKTGAEIWQDAILLYENFGYKFNATYDITKAYNDPGSFRKKGLFDIFDDLFPQNRFVKDKEITRSDWAQSVLTKKMIRYAAFDALVSHAIGRKGIGCLKKLKPIQMSLLPDWATKMCGDMTVVSNIVEDKSGMIHKVDYSEIIFSKGKCQLLIKMDRFPTRIRRMHKVVIVLKTGVKFSTKIDNIKGKSARLIDFRSKEGKNDKFDKRLITHIESDPSNESSAESFMRNRFIGEILSLQSVVEDCSKIERLYKDFAFNRSNKRKKQKRLQLEEGVVANPCEVARYVKKRFKDLNDVQEQAVLAILGSSREIEIIQGPPGTGMFYFDSLENFYADTFFRIIHRENNRYYT
ncbi:ribonuclease H-like domain-containing protein [Paraphysoderma sedebokerense]|nr:ribonuclease H-like domain-containing protein [Paraphysoderma sedebokerense]